jgi:hypothetical protein
MPYKGELPRTDSFNPGFSTPWFMANLIASEVSIPAAPGNRGCHSNKIDEIAAA